MRGSNRHRRDIGTPRLKAGRRIAIAPDCSPVANWRRQRVGSTQPWCDLEEIEAFSTNVAPTRGFEAIPK
jgi:hypothetical protein